MHHILHKETLRFKENEHSLSFDFTTPLNMQHLSGIALRIGKELADADAYYNVTLSSNGKELLKDAPSYLFTLSPFFPPLSAMFVIDTPAETPLKISGTLTKSKNAPKSEQTLHLLFFGQ